MEPDIEDLREPGAKLDYQFLGTLRDDQQSAFDALSRHDCGVLAATTAFGNNFGSLKQLWERALA
ncbi:MAG: hypothetical protein ACYDC8_17115 [Gammaproteobacteria bacterium]